LALSIKGLQIPPLRASRKSDACASAAAARQARDTLIAPHLALTAGAVARPFEVSAAANDSPGT